MSYIKPDTYRDYEFCNYQKTLQRGIGRCGQQSLALVGLLHEQGFETGFFDLSGHTVATVKVADDRWYILDPDFGLAFPYQLKGSERYPERYPRVVEAFFKEYPDKKIVVSQDGEERVRPERLYKVTGHRVRYGGPEIRWGRACPIERAAYILKWLLPFLLFLPLALYVLLSSGRVGTASRA